MRYMGVDLGSKRIGIALSDPRGTFASPLTVVTRRGGRQDLQEVADLAKDYQADVIVVGLPLNLRGESSVAVENMAREIEQLREVAAVPVETYDERLTSAAASKVLIGGGMKREQRKDNIDKVAAAMLLQSYLDRIRLKNAAEQQEQ